MFVQTSFERKGHRNEIADTAPVLFCCNEATDKFQEDLFACAILLVAPVTLSGNGTIWDAFVA